MAQIRIREAHKRDGDSRAVRGVDIAVASGEFVVILGPPPPAAARWSSRTTRAIRT